MAPYTVPALLIALLTTTCINALNNGIGLVPIMGLNTWNSLRCTKALNAKALQAYADAIVDRGLRDLGYQTLVIDDCWSMSTRNPTTGKLQPDPDQFPKGIAEVQQYVRRQNLTLGMYSDRGSKTCAGRPGSPSCRPAPWRRSRWRSMPAAGSRPWRQLATPSCPAARPTTHRLLRMARSRPLAGRAGPRAGWRRGRWR